jgi:hypothetical protein
MLLKTLRDINCNIVGNSKSLEAGILKKDSLVILAKETKVYHDDKKVFLITYDMLFNNKLYSVLGKNSLKNNLITIEDSWHAPRFIENFEDQSYYLWENTFDLITD